MSHPTAGHPLRLLSFCAALLSGGCGGPALRTPAGPPALEEQVSGTTELLQAVSVVDGDVVWVSGHGGTWARTTDGGATWRAGVVPGADTLQFRDVHALGDRTAVLLAAGTGELSRIYRTEDAGATWSLRWTNPEPEGFYDCLDFWDDRRGLAYGDAVDGSLRILLTRDGGRSWSVVPDDALPPALPGEGGFAASGLCVETGADGRAWIAAGNTTATRVFLTEDYGRSWRAVEVPLEAGEGAGLTAISMADTRYGFAFGGVLHAPDEHTRNVARTADGGETWTALPALSFRGAAYGGLVVPDTERRGLVAVGPGGAAVSLDGGESWTTIDERAWWAVGSGGAAATWITGPGGRIARLVWPGCRSTPGPPPLTADPELAAFARQVEADLEAHAWQDLLAVAQRSHYRTQVEEHGMSEPQYLAELFGLHRVDNDIKRGQRVEWSDLERIESVRLESLSPSGADRSLTGTVTLRDGTTRRLQARIAREGQRYVLTGGVG